MIDVSTPDRKATVLLLLVIAGCVDAVGFAETGSFFVSYMSGNTTQAGIALAYHQFDARAWLPLGLIALFVAGCTMGTLIAEKAGRGAAAALLLVEAALVAAASWGLRSSYPSAGLMLLPVGMGLANIVTLRAGRSSPGVTYATGALVQLGIALAGAGRDGGDRDIGFPLAMWLCLLAGGILGGFGRLRFGADVLLAPAAILLLLGLIDLVVSRRRAA